MLLSDTYSIYNIFSVHARRTQCTPRRQRKKQVNQSSLQAYKPMIRMVGRYNSTYMCVCTCCVPIYLSIYLGPLGRGGSTVGMCQGPNQPTNQPSKKASKASKTHEREVQTKKKASPAQTQDPGGGMSGRSSGVDEGWILDEWMGPGWVMGDDG